MAVLSRLSLVLTVVVLCGCGLGVGRTSSAHNPLNNVTESTAILGDEYEYENGEAKRVDPAKPQSGQQSGVRFFELLGFQDHSWGNVTRGFFGVHMATMFGRVRGSPSNAPASSGWMMTQHITGVLGVGAMAVQVDWQQRTEGFNYDRGFGGEMRSKGVVAWLGYSPVGAAGISVGYGRPKGTLSFGSSDNRALYGEAEASGAFYGLALDMFVAGGGVMQWGIRPRIVIGYTAYEADTPLPNVPASYSGLSVGLEVVGTVF
jgi:hypothetical protein